MPVSSAGWGRLIHIDNLIIQKTTMLKLLCDEIRPARRAAASAAIGALAALFLVTACGQVPVEANYPRQEGPTGTNPNPQGPRETIFGPGGMNFLGNGDAPEQAGGGNGIGVNSFLWRASLDTTSFMPLASADPFGGVIITDWYSPPETPDERFKMTIYILDRQLRADGVKVAVFRQERDEQQRWADASVAPQTATELEDAILTRARQLRIDAVGQ